MFPLRAPEKVCERMASITMKSLAHSKMVWRGLSRTQGMITPLALERKALSNFKPAQPGSKAEIQSKCMYLKASLGPRLPRKKGGRGSQRQLESSLRSGSVCVCV